MDRSQRVHLPCSKHVCSVSKKTDIRQVNKLSSSYHLTCMYLQFNYTPVCAKLNTSKTHWGSLNCFVWTGKGPPHIYRISQLGIIFNFCTPKIQSVLVPRPTSRPFAWLPLLSFDIYFIRTETVEVRYLAKAGPHASKNRQGCWRLIGNDTIGGLGVSPGRDQGVKAPCGVKRRHP